METDSELLRRFVAHRSERAFTALVSRHAGIVHCAALRQLKGNEALAQDVTQQAFITLATKAPSLLLHTTLAAWLYLTTHHLVRNARRAEWRRRIRETEAFVMHEPTKGSEARADREGMRAELDNLLLKLESRDREALVLRFLGGNPFSAVGAALQVSEDAARKRVERALDRLREAFAKRGITTSAQALAAALGAESIAAPPALITSVAAGVLAAAAGSTSAGAAVSIGFMTATKLAGIAAAIALASLGIGWQQHGKVRALQAELDLAHQKQTALEGQLAELNSRPAAAIPKTQTFPTLDPTVQYAITIADRVGALKQLLAQRPDQQIPELRLISDEHWVAAASRTANDDDELRRIFQQLRNYGKGRFAMMAPRALARFAEAHNGELPTDTVQLAPYFDPPLDTAILQRYRMIRTGHLDEMPDYAPLLGDIASVDPNYDSVTRITKHNSSIASVDVTTGTIERAIDAFARAHNGQRPSEAVQLAPFLASPIELATLQRYWGRVVLRDAGRSQRQGPQ